MPVNRDWRQLSMAVFPDWRQGVWGRYLKHMMALCLDRVGSTDDGYIKLQQKLHQLLMCLEELLDLQTSDELVPYIESGCDFLHSMLILNLEGPHFFRIKRTALKRPPAPPPLCQRDRISALKTLKFLNALDCELEELELAHEPGDLSWQLLELLWEEIVHPERFGLKA